MLAFDTLRRTVAGELPESSWNLAMEHFEPEEFGNAYVEYHCGDCALRVLWDGIERVGRVQTRRDVADPWNILGPQVPELDLIDDHANRTSLRALRDAVRGFARRA